jgi:pilus assembly protein Flp/PilA
MNISSKVFAVVIRNREDRRGVTALEYGLIASLIAIAIITAVTTLGGNLSAEFAYIAGLV